MKTPKLPCPSENFNYSRYLLNTALLTFIGIIGRTGSMSMIKSKVKLPTLVNIDAYLKGEKSELPNSIENDAPQKIFKQLQDQFNAEMVDETDVENAITLLVTALRA